MSESAEVASDNESSYVVVGMPNCLGSMPLVYGPYLWQYARRMRRFLEATISTREFATVRISDLTEMREDLLRWEQSVRLEVRDG